MPALQCQSGDRNRYNRAIRVASEDSVFRFVITFVACLLLLFTAELLQPVQDHVIVPFTSGLAHVSVWLMRLFDSSVIAQNDAIVDALRGGGIQIVAGCNGVEAVLILVSAVLAFPAPWKHKLIGIGLGFVAIQTLNLVRIISLYYLQRWNQVWFEWFHLYLWQALIVLDALVFWLIWLRWLPRPEPRGVSPATPTLA
jgi:exosortase H (IPTLxxWG-CTERM-specific)